MLNRLISLSIAVALSVLPLGCAAAVDASHGEKPSMSSSDAQHVFQGPAAIELARAIAKGDVAAIPRLASTSDLRMQGCDGVTLLEWAILSRQPKALRVLLEAGADPTQQGLDGETVWHLAAQADDSAYLRTLIEAGADPNALSRSRSNALVSALDAARPDHLRMLLDAGANPNQADVVGYTPLHSAAMLRDYDSVLLLLHKGSDPWAKSNNGATLQSFLFPASSRVPLNAKAKEGQGEVMNWLQSHGVETEARPQ